MFISSAPSPATPRPSRIGIELGATKIAPLAAGAAVGCDGKSVVLATACFERKSVAGQTQGTGQNQNQNQNQNNNVQSTRTFVPMSVEYREKASGAGKIPQHILRRELAPREDEVVLARFVDRALRPSLANAADWLTNLQVICTQMAYDEKADVHVVAVNAASVAVRAALDSEKELYNVEPVACVRITGREAESGKQSQGKSGHLVGNLRLNAFEAPQNPANPDPEIAMEVLVAATRYGVVAVDFVASRPVEKDELKAALKLAETKIPEILSAQQVAVDTILNLRTGRGHIINDSDAGSNGNNNHNNSKGHKLDNKYEINGSVPAAVLGDPLLEKGEAGSSDRMDLNSLFQAAFAVDPSSGGSGGSKDDTQGDSQADLETGEDNSSMEEDMETLEEDAKARKREIDAMFQQYGSAWLKKQLNNENLSDKAHENLRGLLLRANGNDGELVRHDGRRLNEIRHLAADMDVLPSIVHGSSTFQRGLTTVLATATLGSIRDGARVIPYCGPSYRKNFFLHYDFPPYSVNETGRLGMNRRMLGHGQLAERALKPVMPAPKGKSGSASSMKSPKIMMHTLKDSSDKERISNGAANAQDIDFPFSTRVSVETTSSDGSSSMASVCAASLAMASAGVPLADLVAGITVGVLENENGTDELIVDIDSMEDEFGGMDFKLAGTKNGFTAAQLDTKRGANGIPVELLCQAIDLAVPAHETLLASMQETLDAHRENEACKGSSNIPLFSRIDTNPELVKRVLGTRGRTTQGLQQDFDVDIDLNVTDGVIYVFANSPESLEEVTKRIQDLIWVPEIGEIFEGLEVIEVLTSGAVVRIPSHGGEHEAFIHNSELSLHRINEAAEVVSEGDRLTAMCIRIEDFKPRLSVRAVQKKQERFKPRSSRAEAAENDFSADSNDSKTKSNASKANTVFEDKSNDDDDDDDAKSLLWEPEPNVLYEQMEVVKIPNNLRAIVQFPGKPESLGIIHRSEVSPRRIDSVSQVLNVGDKVDAVCVNTGLNGGLPELSMKLVLLRRGKGGSQAKK